MQPETQRIITSMIARGDLLTALNSPQNAGDYDIALPEKHRKLMNLFLEKKDSLNVLVAGIKGPANQFTRFLDKLKVKWTLYQDSPNIPILDAVILSTVHISHEKHVRIKDAYREAGKRIFMAGISSSAIEKEFRDWVCEECIGEFEEGLDDIMSQEVIEHILTVRNAISNLVGEVKEIAATQSKIIERIDGMETTLLDVSSKPTSEEHLECIKQVVDRLGSIDILKQKISLLDEKRLRKVEALLEVLEI